MAAQNHDHDYATVVVAAPAGEDPPAKPDTAQICRICGATKPAGKKPKK